MAQLCSTAPCEVVKELHDNLPCGWLDKFEKQDFIYIGQLFKQRLPLTNIAETWQVKLKSEQVTIDLIERLLSCSNVDPYDVKTYFVLFFKIENEEVTVTIGCLRQINFGPPWSKSFIRVPKMAIQNFGLEPEPVRLALGYYTKMIKISRFTQRYL